MESGFSMSERKQILIVEDEAVNALALQIMLKSAGFDVVGSVAKGEKAVEEAIEKKPDLVLMDIRLAGEIDGIEAARKIQEIIDIPIIFMTGYAERIIENRANALHPVGFLTKPIGYTDIERKIKAYFIGK
jgi:CheY-like chemotaxis protein